MAVYTEVTDEELDAFVARYDIGRTVALKGIADGVENSNYLLQTTKGQYILTLYERRTKSEDLPFFLGVMEHLAGRGMDCPLPVHDREGRALGTLCGRPAAIVTFLLGCWPRRVSIEHCQELGAAMARMHVAGGDFAQTRPNALSVAGWRHLAEAVGTRANDIRPNLSDAIAHELDYLEGHWPQDLPTGLIHADLFPDNVFFLPDPQSGRAKLSGLIDFYFACTDILVYDIAICLNAWCFETDGAFNATKARLMLSGYRRERPLSVAELDALPLLSRGAALRFLLTRTYDWLNTPAGALVKRKDPLEYARKLRFHQGLTGPGAYGLE